MYRYLSDNVCRNKHVVCVCVCWVHPLHKYLLFKPSIQLFEICLSLIFSSILIFICTLWSSTHHLPNPISFVAPLCINYRVPTLSLCVSAWATLIGAGGIRSRPAAVFIITGLWGKGTLQISLDGACVCVRVSLSLFARGTKQSSPAAHSKSAG